MLIKKSKFVFTLMVLNVGLSNCGGTSNPPPAIPSTQPAQIEPQQVNPPTVSTLNSFSVIDEHSFARPEQVRVQHMGMSWTVSFADQILDGTATLLVERFDPQAPLLLDTRDLQIETIEVASFSPDTSSDEKKPVRLMNEALQKSPTWQPTTWELGPENPILGQALSIQLPSQHNLVRIHYRTRPSATGLQWLAPEQTADRSHPFLYSQSQAIHARSWIPCQDTPSVRITFDARVSVPPPFRAVMAAQDLSEEGQPFRFAMDQAIPTYLLALAVGKLTFKSVGPRTGIWAEPSQLAAATSEFADMERMLVAVEKLYGPYRWGRYDVLVLPPAFPFGGMENPRVTFATPTILAGDRSLVSLIAHELAHSWSGNLVTNATWNDLWLNEGFTTYIERRILEALYGRERAEMEAMLGRQSLEDALQAFADHPNDQALHVDLAGRDPDEVFSDIPYEKGALFLRNLEETYGRDAFDPFLLAWFKEHAFTSQTTASFRTFLQNQLIEKHSPLPGRAQLNLEQWIEEPGLPSEAPAPFTKSFQEVDQLREAWLKGQIKLDKIPKTTWTPHHWLHFLSGLPTDLNQRQMAALDQKFRFTQSANSEILAKWFELAARHRYKPAYIPMERFLVSVGRRKFLMPIYQALLESSDGTQQARTVYHKARSGYHAISRQSLDRLLSWNNSLGSAQ